MLTARPARGLETETRDTSEAPKAAGVTRDADVFSRQRAETPAGLSSTTDGQLGRHGQTDSAPRSVRGDTRSGSLALSLWPLVAQMSTPSSRREQSTNAERESERAERETHVRFAAVGYGIDQMGVRVSANRLFTARSLIGPRLRPVFIVHSYFKSVLNDVLTC